MFIFITLGDEFSTEMSDFDRGLGLLGSRFHEEEAEMLFNQVTVGVFGFD